MKQHITVKQFDELSEKGKKKLRKWLKTTEFTSGTLVIDDEIYPLLSIGQMIEFICDHKEEWRLDSALTGGDVRGSACDDLWEGVKEVLK